MNQRDLLELVNSLLDPPTRAIYGTDAFSIFTNALGISMGSVTDFDAEGDIRFQYAPDEVDRRIRHVRTLIEQGLSSYQAIAVYLQSSPRLDPLSEWDIPSTAPSKRKRKPGSAI